LLEDDLPLLVHNVFGSQLLHFVGFTNEGKDRAHGDTDKVRAAYTRGAHWQERVAMAQWWGDYLDTLPARRLGSPEEVALCVAWLIDEDTFCVGEVLNPNAGAVI
jgi:NAD(P)-dependent dehydrogenase (short-subunit alcohol dehydrogenase family)